MKKVGILMGSDSDLPVLEKAFSTLESLQIPFEVHVYSAHRTPKEAKEFSAGARDNGFGVIDTQGRLIIEDSFQSIKYTTNHSHFIAYFDDGKYVTFDHNGTRIPNDTISPTPKW